MPKTRKLLMGIDTGTTHCKVGLFTLDGNLAAFVSHAMQPRRDETGANFFDPQDLWQALLDAVGEAVAKAGPHRLAAIGVAGMAESGILVNRDGLAPLTGIIPWYDTAATPQALQLLQAAGRQAGFLRSGIYPSFKCSLAKLLWLRETKNIRFDNALWLSVPDWIVCLLSGKAATDYSLAGRTFAFDVNRLEWDADFLRQFDLSPDLFPQALPAGTVAGNVTRLPSADFGILTGVPIAVCGHDHVTGAFAAGAIEPGIVFEFDGHRRSLHRRHAAHPTRPAGI